MIRRPAASADMGMDFGMRRLLAAAPVPSYKLGRPLAAAAALLVGAAFFAAGPLSANDEAGTSGAQFLKIGAGARPAGMGEAFTAVADDVNAAAWNPAGLGRIEGPQFTAMQSQWLQGADYSYLAAAYPFAWGTLAVSMASLSIDSIDRRTADTDAPDDTFDASDNVYGLSLGLPLGERWSVGATAKMIKQELDAQSASAASADLGVLWKTPLSGLTAGLAARHLGGELKFVDEGDPQPLTVTGGLAYKTLSDRLTVSGDVRKPRDNDVQLGLGGEFRQPLPWEMSGALRAGYNTAGTDPSDGLTGVGFGMGLSWRSVSFDVAYVPYGFLGNTFRYAFLIRF